MLGIVFATQEEASAFLATYKRGRFDGLEEGGVSHDDDVLVALTGTGKIKATLRTERLLRQHRLKRLIHAGTCTALNEDLVVGKPVGAAQVFEGDRIELAAPTYPRMPLDVPFEGIATGTLVTQDHTVQGQEERSYWQRIADLSDMSGYAVAYVAATHGVPCHIVKVVTGHFGTEDANLRKTLASAYEKLGAFLVKEVDKMLQAA